MATKKYIVFRDDIMNNLTDGGTQLPLSAEMGKELNTNKQDKIDSSHKIASDLITDADSVNKFVNSGEKAQITLNQTNITTINEKISSQATSSNQLLSESEIDDKIESIQKGFTFKGYVSSTQPSTDLRVGNLWYQSSTMPTSFPVQVKTYTEIGWSAETTDYTPTALDLWANLNDNHGYYYFGSGWNLVDAQIELDGITLDRNLSGQAEIKNGGVSTAKLDNTLQGKITTYDGYATSKLDKNADITAGTKCKISYDTKGLITNGADLSESDIPTLSQSKITNLTTDLSNKANKSEAVSNIAYDTTNKKITKTINGNTTDVVSVATIKTDLSLAKGDVGLGNVDNTSDANKPISTATQTALNNKADKSTTVNSVSYDTTNKKIIQSINGTASDVVLTETLKNDLAGSIASGNTGFVNGGDVYTQLATKQAAITGGASTITTSNLTKNRALISNGSGKVAVSAVTSTELGYLDGVTSNVQTQLNNKEETANKVTSLSSSSTDTQYPSAKCVYDIIGDVATLIAQYTNGNGV